VRKPVSQQDIIAAIKKHENTLHRDTAAQIKTLHGKVDSLSQDINATSAAVVENGKAVQNMAETMKSFIDAKNGIGIVGDGIIYVGKLALAISAIGGSIWAAIHFGKQ